MSRWKSYASITSMTATSVLALSLGASPAQAVCTLSNGAGITVACSDQFDAELSYDSETQLLTLDDDEIEGDGETDTTQTELTDLSGNDTITLETDDSPDSLDVFEDGINSIDLREGDDVVTVNGGTLTGEILGGEGNDTYNFIAGSNPPPLTTGTDVSFAGGPGDDTIFIGEGVAVGELAGGSGNDDINLQGSVVPLGDVAQEFAVFGGADDDTITIGPSGSVSGDVGGGSGNDIIVSAGSVSGNIEGQEGSDSVDIVAGSVENVLGGGGADAIRVLGGTVNGSVDGGSNDGDTFLYASGVIGGAVSGFDTFVVDPTDATSNVLGDLDFEGDGNSEIIIRNVNLPNLAATDIDEIEFTGFAQGSIENSDIGPLFGVLGIANLAVTNSRVGLIAQSALLPDGGGQLTVVNSNLDFINGLPSDQLTVGGFSITDSTIGIDLDPVSEGLSDRIVITGSGPDAFVAAGSNLINVNFLSAPDATEDQIVPVASFFGEGAPDAVEVAEAFRAVGVGPFANPTIALNLLTGPDGGLFLETSQVDELINNQAATGAAQATQGSDVVSDINTDLADTLTGFAPGASRIVITPTFGVFANGSFGRLDHDGFDVTGGGLDVTTPEFDADSFSLIGVAELDASAEFGLGDDDIGVKFSVFGGYVQNDVTFSRDLGGGIVSPFEGSGDNSGGVIGGTVLASKIQGQGNLNYGLLSGALFFGNTDVVNANTGGVGDYNTSGVILSGKVGRNMPIADRVRLDLRVGAAFNEFAGNDFIDSTNVYFGRTTTRYGLLSFEPGLSTAIPVGSVVVQPSLRGLVSTRIGYQNKASVNGVGFEFDDGDVTVGAQLGAAVRFNENLSGGAFIDGRLTEDSRSILGKLAVKYTIPRT